MSINVSCSSSPLSIFAIIPYVSFLLIYILFLTPYFLLLFGLLLSRSFHTAGPHCLCVHVWGSMWRCVSEMSTAGAEKVMVEVSWGRILPPSLIDGVFEYSCLRWSNGPMLAVKSLSAVTQNLQAFSVMHSCSCKTLKYRIFQVM
jgi:hypothetical protein